MFRRKGLVITILLLVVVLTILFCACDNSKIKDLESQIQKLQEKVNGYEADYSPKDIVIYIGEKKFEINTGKAFLHEALKDLKNEGKITAYDYGQDDLNPFLSAVDVLQQDLANYKYFSVWHNVDNFSLKAVYSEYGNPGRSYVKEDDYGTKFVVAMIDNNELYYSNVGVGILPLFNGCTYAVLVD